MQTLWNISLSIGLMGLSAKSAIAINPIVAARDSEIVPLEQTIAQVSSPYQQLLQTRNCVGCNLSNLDLQGLDLSGANLQDANLSNANLSNSNLRQANLSGANLYLSNFTGSDLSQANFNNVNAKSANFTTAIFRQSSFTETIATYANFSNTDFSDASIDGSNFSDANFTAANFDNASITATQFNYATLDQVNFSTAHLGHVSLTSASTEGTSFPTERNASIKKNDADSISRSEDFPNDASDTSSKKVKEKKVASPSSIADGTDKNLEALPSDDSPANPKQTEFEAKDSPLAKRQFQFTTAEHLKRGELLFNAHQRFFFTSSPSSSEGTPFYSDLGLRFGITNDLEIAAALQIVDSASIDPIGFNVSIDDSIDFALELKQKIWEDPAQKFAFSGAVSLSGYPRSFGITNTVTGTRTRLDNDGIVPAVQLPFTAKVSDQLNVTVAPTVAFFQNDGAIFLPQLPVANPETFGTTFGLSGSVSYQLGSRALLWGDAFVPITGNNSTNINTASPTKTVAFNSGVRYLVNPRLGLDVFATNTLGSLGPLSLTAFPNEIGLGLGVTVLPDFISKNRKYPNNHKEQLNRDDTALTIDGLGFADGGTVPSGKFLFNLQGGSQGILTALRYGVVKDFELFGFLDYISSDVDESEQGFGAKVRWLNQKEGGAFTGSAALTIGTTNDVFVNFLENDSNEFQRRGLRRNVPFVVSGDNAAGGGRFIATASLPLHYQANKKINVWFTPIVAVAQRVGVDIGGFNLGASFEPIRDVSFVTEVGANFLGEGNTFIGGRLVDRLPWNVAARWDPSSLFGINKDKSKDNNPYVEIYLTNRVGSSPWHQLRVRDQNELAVGAGISIPFFH